MLSRRRAPSSYAPRLHMNPVRRSSGLTAKYSLLSEPLLCADPNLMGTHPMGVNWQNPGDPGILKVLGKAYPLRRLSMKLGR